MGLVELLLTAETGVRLSVFAVVLACMIIWERLKPHRPTLLSRSRRWFSALSLAVINSVLVRLAAPLLGTGVAVRAASQQTGLLNQIDLPFAAEILIAMLILDLVVYWQHRLFHLVPLLWRFHRVHHADPDVDTTTGLRFHPVEALISMVVKLATVYLLGADVTAVILFEVLLNASSLFNHANIRLPFDYFFRWLIVTPGMHRVHHSIIPHEHNRNFGFSFPWWDRLFGSYLARGSTESDLGLTVFREEEHQQLFELLKQPFISSKPAH
ncbi:MAG: sterol desaturase family protein [Proteobacteria bacterium]|nr:sterol desaturase family protein [Pseudomonadota bacterium]